jgi:hypothetical protein
MDRPQFDPDCCFECGKACPFNPPPGSERLICPYCCAQWTRRIEKAWEKDLSGAAANSVVKELIDECNRAAERQDDTYGDSGAGLRCNNDCTSRNY